MKRLNLNPLVFLPALLIIPGLFLPVSAQSPHKISYQCVVRSASGTLIANRAVGLKIAILQGSTTGTVVFSETYSPVPQTNANGLLTVEIGSGTASVGTLASVDWSAGPYYLKTETDPEGGTNYSITGTSQLLSVPYALYSKTAGNGFSGNYNDLTNKPVLFDGTWNSLTVKPAGFADGIDNVDDADNSITNEIQALSLSGTVLTLSNGGGSVTLPSSGGGDNWGTQSALTDATLAGNGLTATPLKIAQQSATAGQVLKWDGTTWKPENDIAGGLILPYNGTANTTGPAFGIENSNTTPNSSAIFGRSSSAINGTIGVWGSSTSVSGVGVLGTNYTETGGNFGVMGRSFSTAGFGVAGIAQASTGNNYGVYGLSSSATGTGVYGYATGTTGINYGVFGISSSTMGYGVLGIGNTAVRGETDSPSGYGLEAWCSSTTGEPRAVQGAVASSSGYSGFFLGGSFYVQSNVGIGITNPAALLHVQGTGTGQGNVLFTGECKFSSPGNAPASGAGTRMMWYPDRAAFRAGYTDGPFWDSPNIGIYSVALGSSTTASGATSTAIGNATTATGENSTAMGFFTTAPSYCETVIGAHNSVYTPASATSWNANDRLFVIGNGTGGAPGNAMTVLKNGKIGVGNSNPDFKLDVSGDRIRLITGTEWIAMRTDGTEGFLDLSYGGGKLVIQGSSAGETILLNPSLNALVGVRTWNPQYELDVTGNIRATGSVYYGGTAGSASGTAYTKPDYVFSDDYHRLPTEAVAEFLQSEGHLPWITSAREEKAQNGDVVDMTRMAFETVESVENMQLQIIEMNKQIKQLNEIVIKQQKEIENLKVQLH